jgi:soluble lytic murein transglycosylase-like protein
MHAIVAISTLVLAASGASAQTTKSQDRVAAMPPAALAVDPNGVLRRVNPPDQPPQIIGAPPLPGGSLVPSAGSSTKNIAHPCPGALAALTHKTARELVKRIATQEQFFPDFVISVSKVESAFVSNAFSGRAYGLMQLTPKTAERFKVDICDPEGNVRGGVRYLRHLHARFRNPFYILAAYNAGEQALIERNGLPPYPETLTYIARVMDDFYEWPAIADGTRRAEAEARDRSLAGSPQRIETTTASLPAERRQLRGAARPAIQSGPVEWKGGFVANFD